MSQAFVEGRAHAGANRLLYQPQRHGALRGNRLGEFLCACRDIACGDHLVDQSDPQCLIGTYEVAGIQQLESGAHPNETRQALCAPPARQETEVDLGLAKFRLFRRDPDVAGHCQLAPAAETKAIDGRNGGFGKSIYGEENGGIGHDPILIDRAPSLELRDVGPGYKGLVAGSGDDHDSDVVVLRQFVQFLDHATACFDIEGIEFIGTVDRERSHVTVDTFENYFFSGHS